MKGPDMKQRGKQKARRSQEKMQRDLGGVETRMIARGSFLHTWAHLHGAQGGTVPLLCLKWLREPKTPQHRRKPNAIPWIQSLPIMQQEVPFFSPRFTFLWPNLILMCLKEAYGRISCMPCPLHSVYMLYMCEDLAYIPCATPQG